MVLTLMPIFFTTGCSSFPKYEEISAKYVGCDPKAMKPVEVTNHGWYRSWYVDCGGVQYYCRYSKGDINGWNGCQSADSGGYDGNTTND